MNDTNLFTIRHAEIKDKTAANIIHRISFPNDKVYSYANNIGCYGTINLVAELEGKVIGFVSALVNQPNPRGRYLWERMRPYIGFLGVLENFRRAGVGSSLVQEVSRMAFAATGKDRIYLECEIENGIAQNLYEKLGFEAIDFTEIEKTFAKPPYANSVVFCGERDCLRSGE